LFFLVLLPLVLLFGLAVLSIPWVFTVGILSAVAFAFISLLWGLIIRRARYQAWNASSWVFRILIGFWAWAFIFPVSFNTLRDWTLLTNNTNHLQVPLDMPNGIAINSKGDVYLSILSFQRIQAYDKNGVFTRGWSANIGQEAGNHRLVVDEQDNLHVLNDYSHAIYDAAGRLLSYSESDQSETLVMTNPRRASDSDGNVYEFEDKSESESFKSLFSKVVKTTPDGHQSVFITDPLPLWLVKRNFPAFGFAMLSMIPAGLLGWLADKAKKTQQPTDKTRIGPGFFLAVLFAKITRRKVDLAKYLPTKRDTNDTLCRTIEHDSDETLHEDSEPVLILSSVFCPAVTSRQGRFLQVFFLVWGTGFLGGFSYIGLEEVGLSIPAKPYFMVFGILWLLVIMKLTYLLKKYAHDETRYRFYANRLEYDDAMSARGRRRVQYSEIEDVELQQVTSQKKRGLGTIYITLRQRPDDLIELYNIANVVEAFDKVESLVGDCS
jgi:hypothetical protein